MFATTRRNLLRFKDCYSKRFMWLFKAYSLLMFSVVSAHTCLSIMIPQSIPLRHPSIGKYKRQPHILQIDDRLAYRMGCPILPVLPVQTESSNDQILEDIPRDDIDKILARIGFYKYEVVHRFHRGQEPSDENITFLVLASYYPGCQREWRHIVRRLCAVMPKNSKIAIEIVDKDVARHLPPPREIRSNQSAILNTPKHLLPTITSAMSCQRWITVDILNWYLPTHSCHQPIRCHQRTRYIR